MPKKRPEAPPPKPPPHADEVVYHFRMPRAYGEFLKRKALEASRKTGRAFTVAEWLRRDIEERIAAEKAERAAGKVEPAA